MSDDSFTRATIAASRDPRGAASAGAYLVLITRDSSSLRPLPLRGSLTIGRAPECEIQLADGAASRRHSTLEIDDGAVLIRDLGSHNGTVVNGERIPAPRRLTSGDVITIGDTLLVLHREAPALSAARAVDAEQFCARLELEVERAVEFARPLVVLVLVLAEAPRDRAALLGAAAEVLRRVDLISWEGERTLLGLLPERGGAPEEIRRLVDALAAATPVTDRPGAVKVGVAACPDDGCDAASLLQAARAAAAAEDPGAAPQGRERLVIGERSILVADPAMTRLFALIRRLAPSELPVLISGETGVGKENAAYAVHAFSPRAAGPFVPINCAAIPEHLVESELFGYEKGAFSGAVAAKPGLLETAAAGTVFLDELGELSLPVQAKLLRFLETRRLTRVGALREREVDLRVVAATHRDLEAEVRAGRFREDLFFRLVAATVVLPPLRDRPREVPLLARAFLAEACARLGRPPLGLSGALLRFLARYRFPGNVRELKNAMEFAAAAAEGDVAEVEHLPPRIAGAKDLAMPPAPDPAGRAAPPEGAAGRVFRPLSEELQELERRRVAEAYEAAGYVQTRAAELISVPLRTYIVKLKQHGISAPEGRRKGPARSG